MFETVPENLTIHQVTGEQGNPSGIFYPTTTQEVQKAVKVAAQQQRGIITVGGFTGLTGATFAKNQELLINLAKMNQIISLDEETLTLTVEAGVTLQQIQDYLAATPYFYAPDPGSKEATVGGTAATNAGGMRALKYGVTRDNIRGLTVVLASGEVLQLGGLNNKASSGYDLKDLLIGSEGTLGIITELQLKLRPKPASKQDVLIGFHNLTELAPVVFKILSSGVAPAALEFFEKDGLKYASDLLKVAPPEVAGAAFLLLTLDGNPHQIAQASQELQDILKESQLADFVVLTSQQAEIVWQLRGSIVSGVEVVSQQEPLDIVVPINQITQTILYMKETTQTLGLKGVFFGHAGDGNIHGCIMRQDLAEHEWHQRLDSFLNQLYQEIANKKGLPSAEHGIGLLKKKYFLAHTDPIQIQLMRQIKQALDPTGLLNPGKIF